MTGRPSGRCAAQDALADEIERVCECDGEEPYEIDSERSSFDYGAEAYDGAGNVITDYFDCPCKPLRAALASPCCVSAADQEQVKEALEEALDWLSVFKPTSAPLREAGLPTAGIHARKKVEAALALLGSNEKEDR